MLDDSRRSTERSSRKAGIPATDMKPRKATEKKCTESRSLRCDEVGERCTHTVASRMPIPRYMPIRTP